MKTEKMYSTSLADTIIKRYPNPHEYPYEYWSYPHGVMLWGMIRLWEKTNRKKYYDYVFKYVDTHVKGDGSIPAFTGHTMDDMMTGSIIVWAYMQTGKNKYKLACDTIRKTFDTYPRSNTGAFEHGNFGHQFWVDGVFMGQMFLSKYGKYVDDSNYCFDEAVKQITLIDYHCRKPNSYLLLHAWNEDKTASWADKETGQSSEVWSEGLGWYALILVEVLSIMPIGHKGRDQVLLQLTNLLSELKKHQDSTSGLWYQVVDKGHLVDNWCDTSGSAMFVYTIKKAIELGLCDKEEYLPIVNKAYKGLKTKAIINEDGLIDIIDACDGVCVQDNYKIYIDYLKTNNAKEAVATFLWAAVIMEEL